MKYLVLFCVFICVGCTPIAEDPTIAERLQTDSDGRIDLSFVKDGDWECAYIFAPYRTEDEIAETIGFKWPHYESSRSRDYDQYSLLIFTSQKKVVAWSDVQRSPIDLLNYSHKECIPRANPVIAPLQIQK